MCECVCMCVSVCVCVCVSVCVYSEISLMGYLGDLVKCPV